jgi:hypothetical protein
VIFHTVRLQPNDVPQDLVALGLRIKRKKGDNYILQPCPAYQESKCAIYDSRPERCRRFECQQLQRLGAGEITEAEALGRIQDVQQRVAHITALLDEAGTTDPKRPLSKRCEKILAEPSFDPPMMAIHQQITREFQELDAILDAEFRVPPDPGSGNAS